MSNCGDKEPSRNESQLGMETRLISSRSTPYFKYIHGWVVSLFVFSTVGGFAESSLPKVVFALCVLLVHVVYLLPLSKVTRVGNELAIAGACGEKRVSLTELAATKILRHGPCFPRVRLDFRPSAAHPKRIVFLPRIAVCLGKEERWWKLYVYDYDTMLTEVHSILAVSSPDTAHLADNEPEGRPVGGAS